ncbi:alpha-ketoglutarate-dependent dioxygenase AlkB [Alteromonas sp. ASW11-36]|uniref:Alpha-ketoglutarate-dependent dioxygenase AlkB n=1 Tax=Alteromonas arenosi TaxID=3055817 RepID=A0ABT7SZV0_9ALTE|nr:alpha-ketoglutarate-dependent dioxygenase AlkB [Alteromonas sp. ASW11-36]MDM7861714.1 alpha-ketoglutarate-dependent dioxygenase AlkB [Alteromonas sp. ASW11-36]
MQSSFFDQQLDSPSVYRLPMHDAEVIYIPNWLAAEKATQYYHKLAESLVWRQDTIRLYGKEHLIPRQQCWYGDSGAVYQYSGLDLTPLPWTEELQALKQACESASDAQFNSVLANWYQHGQHSMGMHSDDEPELGAQPTIASLSLGAERNFIFKHKRDKTRHSVLLEHGSLLIMAGMTQDHWQHGLNKTVKPIGGRINLTFRQIVHDHSTTNHR